MVLIGLLSWHLNLGVVSGTDLFLYLILIPKFGYDPNVESDGLGCTSIRYV